MVKSYFLRLSLIILFIVNVGISKAEKKSYDNSIIHISEDRLAYLYEVEADSIVYKAIKEMVFPERERIFKNEMYCSVAIDDGEDMTHPALTCYFTDLPSEFFWDGGDGLFSYQVIDDIIVFFQDTKSARGHLKATDGEVLTLFHPRRPVPPSPNAPINLSDYIIKDTVFKKTWNFKYGTYIMID